MDSIYSDPAVRAAVRAVASHDPSITQREMDQLHTRALDEYNRIGTRTLDHSHRTWTRQVKATADNNSTAFLGWVLDVAGDADGWTLRCALEALHGRALTEYIRDHGGHCPGCWTMTTSWGRDRGHRPTCPCAYNDHQVPAEVLDECSEALQERYANSHPDA
jgi:hypothetical protein